jgi:hypothetical protein
MLLGSVAFEVLILWRIAALGEEQLGREEQLEPLCGPDILKGWGGPVPGPRGGWGGVGGDVCAHKRAPLFVHIVRCTLNPMHSMLTAGTGKPIKPALPRIGHGVRPGGLS